MHGLVGCPLHQGKRLICGLPCPMQSAALIFTVKTQCQNPNRQPVPRFPGWYMLLLTLPLQFILREGEFGIRIRYVGRGGNVTIRSRQTEQPKLTAKTWSAAWREVFPGSWGKV